MQRGGQTRWTCELSGLCKVCNPKRWPAEGVVLFRPIMWLYSASVVLVWDSFLPCTLLWPYSSKVHLVLATAQTKMYLPVPSKKSSTVSSRRGRNYQVYTVRSRRENYMYRPVSSSKKMYTVPSRRDNFYLPSRPVVTIFT